MRKGCFIIKHNDKFHEHVTLTSSNPTVFIIYCQGVGNYLPDFHKFKDALVLCITGGKSFAPTGTLLGGYDDDVRIVDDTDASTAELVRLYITEFLISGAFFPQLVSEEGRCFEVRPPASHFRPACPHVVDQVRLCIQSVIEWGNGRFGNLPITPRVNLQALTPPR